MPNCIIPRASGAHRVACLALYRALLKQSSALRFGSSDESLPSKSVEVLTNLIHFRFRQDRKLESPTRIVNGFKAGYAALDLVHACNNNSAVSLAQLASLLNSTALQAEQTTARRAALSAARSPTSPQKLGKIAHLRAIATKANTTRFPGSKPVLERPLPLSEIKGGKRRIPNMISAQGLPFLRYSKPQPISLSRVLRQMQNRDQKKANQQESFKSEIVIGQWEDEWDELVETQLAEEQGLVEAKLECAQDPNSSARDHGHKESWRREIDIAESEVRQQIKEYDRKNAEMGRKMWAIVVKERDLAAQEKREAKIQRRIEREAAATAPVVLQATSDKSD